MRRIHAITLISCLAAAAAAPNAAIAAPKTKDEIATEMKARIEGVKPAIAAAKPNLARAKAFAMAEKQGLVMKGYKDTAGLSRIIKHHHTQFGLGRSALDEQAKKIGAMGVDFAAIRELDSLLRSGPIAIERIEFVPGWGASEQSNGIIMNPGDLGGYEGNEFSPGFPSKGSLAGYSYSFQRRPDGGYTATTVYDDGSHIIEGSSPTEGGGKEHFAVVFGGGQVRHVERTVTDKEGNIIEEHVYDSPDGRSGSEAEDDFDSRPNSSGSSVTVGEVEVEPGDDEGGDAGGDIDEFQPADGNAGSFCPMTLDICRREYERAVKSREKVFAGMVFVNPGDPDDQPEGARLVYDPQDLVINPYFSRRGGSKTAKPGQFRMMIPVLINPPGPNEE